MLTHCDSVNLDMIIFITVLGRKLDDLIRTEGRPVSVGPNLGHWDAVWRKQGIRSFPVLKSLLRLCWYDLLCSEAYALSSISYDDFETRS